MSINVWFVYNDTANLWLADGLDPGQKWSRRIGEAKEFHSEESAIKASDDNNYMVFGWVQ